MKKTSNGLIFKNFKSIRASNIVDLIKVATDELKSKVTLMEYINNPNQYEILNNGRIVCKKELRDSQRNFRNNYHKVKEFFD